MEIFTSIPIWVKCYWVILIIFYAVGNYSECKDEERGLWIILVDTLSVIFISIFLIGFFNNKIGTIFGLWIVPMAISGIVWELFIAKKEIDKLEQNPDPELSEFENKCCIIFGLALNNLIVVPGYSLGIWLCFNEFRKIV